MAWGGLLIGIIVIVGLMYLHNLDTEKDLLSAEHIMAMIGVPLTILSYDGEFVVFNVAGIQKGL